MNICTTRFNRVKIRLLNILAWFCYLNMVDVIIAISRKWISRNDYLVRLKEWLNINEHYILKLLLSSDTLVCKKKWHLCKKNDTRCKKKWHLLQKKCHPLQKKCHPLKKSNSHNIKLYDFNLNMIHFILIFYNK